MTNLRISVVIPTCRRPDLLLRCLNAVCTQDFGARDYEVIIADDGARFPNGNVAQLVAEFRHARELGGHLGPEIRYFAVTMTSGPAGARNLGWRSARAAIVAFTDDDTVPSPHWLREAWKVMVEGFDAVTGKVEMPLPARPTDYERDAAGLTQAEFVTANCLVRREALETVGGFDERFTLAWREDSDLQFSLLKQGLIIGCAPNALVVHPLRPAPWGSSMAAQRKVFFDALLYKKHPRFYRERIRRWPPLTYYLSVLSVLIALAATVTGAPTVALAALLLWLTLTLECALRRLRGASNRWDHVFEMLVTSVAIPPLSLYWRLRGAWRYRVAFT